MSSPGAKEIPQVYAQNGHVIGFQHVYVFFFRVFLAKTVCPGVFFFEVPLFALQKTDNKKRIIWNGDHFVRV